MYGLKPEDLGILQTLERKQLSQIAVGQYDLHFNFHPDGCVHVEGLCQLIDESGTVIDRWDQDYRSNQFRFFELLGQSVVTVAIDTPRSFTALFQNGYTIPWVDNSDQYESFSVGNLYV